jgi:hypothetical protein
MPSSYLVSVPPGYAVRMSDATVDAWHFEQLVRSAADLAPDAAAPALEQALGLWRGPVGRFGERCARQRPVVHRY